MRHLAVQVALAGLLVSSTSLGQEASEIVLTASLQDEAITPGTVQYLDRAMRRADEQQAQCLVIILDTPGGLLTSTRRLVKQIMASRTPIVVYVAPQGSRAASAGVFVTMAAHVAAMAPGTTIGAAHPVQVGGLPMGPRPSPAGDSDEHGSEGSDNGRDNQSSSSSAVEEKVVNDTVAWVRALANERGRNAQWATDAVKKSVSITADEAADKNVVDLVAPDIRQLLEDIDGREINLTDGTRTLNTADARLRNVSMWWGERLLTLISQPNVAFLLLMFGFYGVLFEFYSPGWGVPGTLGVICTLLGLFGLSVLPVNYLGLALIFVSLGLLTAEVFVTSYGVLAIAGTACLVAGAVVLVDSPSGFARVSLSVVLPVAGATAAITLLLVRGIVRSFRSPVRTGGEGLVGQPARADEQFSQDDGEFHGTVRIHGERWSAVSRQPLHSGQACKVEGRDGLTLFVSAGEE